jgi:pyruvate kinase
MDTKGPEVRTTRNAEDTTEYKTGDRVKIIGNPEKETVRGCIYVTYPNFVNDLSVGAKILIDDGDLELKVTDKDEEALYCEVCNDATLASRKA